MKPRWILLLALAACGSNESKEAKDKPAPTKAPDATIKRTDLGVTADQIGCGATDPVAIACDTGAGGKVVRVTVTTKSPEALARALPALVDTVAPDMASSARNIALLSLPSSKTAEVTIDGLAYRYESTDEGERYWIEPE